MQSPTESDIAKWLDQAGIKHYLCGECHGLHLADVQSLDNVVECRLFLEQGGLLLSTELEVRPSILMHLSADLTALNINYPYLKLFLDVVDDGRPQLVASDFFHLQAGINLEQFNLFVQSTLDATRELIAECTRMDYLGERSAAPDRKSLH